MARPRSYESHELVAAAEQVFWERGYRGTALGDLEDATDVSRSSLYLAFGSKRGLFDAALTEYKNGFIDSMLGPVEAPGAGLREAAGYFLSLATLFDDRQWQRGCLMWNSVVELARLDPAMEVLGAQFADRYRTAFLHALRGAQTRNSMDSRQATRRADFLAAAAMGVWLAVRVDHSAAAATSRAIGTEITSWGATRTTRRPRTQAR
jgi:AcrR family transcriptional regulator